MRSSPGLGREVCNVLIIIWLFWTCNSYLLVGLCPQALSHEIHSHCAACWRITEQKQQLLPQEAHSSTTGQDRTNRQIRCSRKWDNAHLQNGQKNPLGSSFILARKFLGSRAAICRGRGAALWVFTADMMWVWRLHLTGYYSLLCLCF